MYDSSDDQHSVGLVQAGLVAVYKAELCSTKPRLFQEAMHRPDADLWFKAASEEIDAHCSNSTWESVQLPAGRRAMGCCWVFKVKQNADGTVERYKACLVAKGYSQCPGVDFDETFAPTAKWAALRAILAICALKDWEADSVDISNAFLNGDLVEEVYMEQPDGFEQGKLGHVLWLRKSLYGLKQVPRVWNEKLDSALQEMGFTRVHCDKSIYVWEKKGIKVIVPVFVDDLTIVSPSKEAKDAVIKELFSRFMLRYLGPISLPLGFHITRDRPKRTMTLDQHQYILDLLDTFGCCLCDLACLLYVLWRPCE
jgi:hypothetical protein